MIFFEHKISACDSNVINFTAKEDGKVLGECTLVLSDGFAEITEINCKESIYFIVEGLVKAAFNFAANRNYYIGRCSVEDMAIYLESMNFHKSEKGYENDIPSILMGSCGNCNK